METKNLKKASQNEILLFWIAADLRESGKGSGVPFELIDRFY
jgi:hypothetical protein